MKTQNTFLLAIVIAAVITACGGNKIDAIKAKIEKLKKQQSETKVEIEELQKSLIAAGDSSKSKVKVKDVAVAEVTAKEFKHYLEIQGKVDSDKNVLISARASGTLTKIYVNKGDVVRAGSLLAMIDDDVIQSSIQDMQTNLALSKTIYEKQKALWDQKIGTEIQYLQAKTNYESLTKKLDQLKQQQDAYKIKATIDGTIDEIYPNEGEVIGAGMPAVRIINTSAFKVTAEIAEGYINKVKKGDKVTLFFPDINYTMETTVKVVSNIISPTNRTFLVEFDLKNAPQSLKANMLTYVKILDYSKPSVLVIPVNIIQHSETGDFVYTVVNSKAVKTNIQTGSIYRTDAEVISGLKEGDKIIVLGYQDVTNGQAISIK
jgi:membrane fusion protein (multidrug efflux system)